MRIFSKLFGGKSTLPSPGALTPQEADRIIRDYGKALRTQGSGVLRDASQLPYPKNRIKQAFALALRLSCDPAMSSAYRAAYLTLAQWQDGAGQGDGLTVSEADLTAEPLTVAKRIAGSTETTNGLLRRFEVELAQLEKELLELGGVCENTSTKPPLLIFKDADAALEYACKYLECPLHEGSQLPAVVLDSQKLLGAPTAVKTQEDGRQLAALRVASKDGGFLVLAMTIGKAGPQLRPGHLVAWQAYKHHADIARTAKDERFGWVGVILGTLEPEYRDSGWVGGKKFTA